LRERPELLAAIEKNPNVVAEFLSRVGILDSIESNRVKGMQRAKDKQISELTGEISNLKNELTKQLDLASAFEKEISSLKAELAKERNHSAEIEKALTKEKENLLNVTGRALRVGKEKKVEGKTNRDRLASLLKIHRTND
jgi:septal ring factor EnvC (AmiA/AmiB activator)